MELHTRNLIIDTQYFVKHAFDFDKKELLLLRELIHKGKSNLYLTDITVAEVQKKIRDKFTSAFDKLDKSDIIYLKQVTAFKNIFSQHIREESVEEVLTSFENFLEQWKVKIIHSNQVSILQVHQMYANLNPPFSEKKKYEFPDAFALESIKIWRNENNESAYLISEDTDWQRYIKQHSKGTNEGQPSLIYLNDLSTFIDRIVRKEEELEDLVKYSDKVLDMQWDIIKAKIIEKFNHLEFILRYSDEKEINAIHPLDCRVFGKDILSALENMAFYELSLEIDVIVKYSIPNYGNAFYDKEDDRYYNLSYTERYSRVTLHENCQIDFSYRDGLERNFELLYVEFENEEIRIPINEEEYININEWTDSPQVEVRGAKDGKITQSSDDKMEFENFAQAKKVFPKLDLFRESGDFTAMLEDWTDGKFHFQSWQSIHNEKE